jgi:hypothetical protein
MAILVKNIIPRKFAENAQTGQYTAVNAKAVIDKFTATNVTAAPVTINVHLVAGGGSAGTSNVVVFNKAIQVGETYTFPELVGQLLEGGGFISTVASAASALVISATGREIT